jgi:hypothetical protein
MILGTPPIIHYFFKDTKSYSTFNVLTKSRCNFTCGSDLLEKDFGRAAAWCYVVQRRALMYTGGYSSDNLMRALFIDNYNVVTHLADMSAGRRGHAMLNH